MNAKISCNTKSAHTPQLILSGVCALFAIVTIFLIPNISHAEYIKSFVSDITVYKDSTFKVAENITYVFTADKHGIFRCIPTIHQDKASSLFKERYIAIDLKAVSMDGQEVPYTIDTQNDKFCIKVGDPNTIITGTHEYAITYSVGGAISYTSSGESDLYYNVTGNEWNVEIKDVQVNVSSPDGVLMRERACYHGFVGKTDSCTAMKEENGVVHFAQRLLGPHQGVTIAQALNLTKIQKDVRERFNPTIVLWSLIASVLIIVGIFFYRYKTKFKTGKPIIPQYEPYPGVKPMYAGLLFDGKLDPRDITAGIVYLAQQGFITIKKIDRKVLFFFEVDDYEIELIRPVMEIVNIFEKEIIKLIFDESSPVASKVTLSDLKSNYVQKKKNVLQLQELDKLLKIDLKKQGFFTGLYLPQETMILYTLPFVFLAVIAVFFVDKVVVYIALAISVLIFTHFNRRTRKGYEVLDRLKGFKDFLSVTDKERFIFHNAPQKSPQQFMEYLPYAIAFGVEKQWANTFEEITIPNPDWYDGGGLGTFSAVGLTQSLGGFSSTFASSSGVSASSGGGASGGGSGGGGGGSW